MEGNTSKIREIETRNIEELEHFKNAKTWQLSCLKKNPYYTCWGNHEDYMSNNSEGWNSPFEIKTVKELFDLDCYNELVNFYFFLSKNIDECPFCNNTGLSKKAREIHDSFYGGWSSELTQDEVDALIENGRLSSEEKKYGELTAELVNKLIKDNKIHHDSLNSYICIKQRCKRLNIEMNCWRCQGEGVVNYHNETVLGLQMWFLHPRKGCSRGVLLTEIKKEEVQDVIKYLKEARDRNQERFSKL